jgi:branched-chain amino acid transport system ATP-binding protein
MAARSEVLYERRQGRAKLLLVRDLEVFYGHLQVLFGVNLEIDEGEIVALLGTNGAGKSTLLKAISGIAEADRGAVIFDGRDMTHAPPSEIARRGVIQMPGGAGVFGSLTVEENLRAGAWTQRKSPSAVEADLRRVNGLFPVLARRLNTPAADLSGGQQQMLALAMSFLCRPRLLMIDELSLGLAPVVVEQLLPVLRQMADEGVTIILVEQSVNVALTVAETAYFMEKGQIRFHGPTAELLERPDLLRSVFLEGAGPVSGDRPGLQPTHTGSTEPAVTAVDPDDRPLLEVTGVTCSFGGVRAVDGVDLTVASGEVVGLVGPNGAGKTTLLDAISGFVACDAGRVVLDGDELTGRSANERAGSGLGRSFQDGRLFPALTVTETLAVALDDSLEVKDPVLAALRMPAAYDSERRARLRVEELIDLFNLGRFADKFTGELSTGSRRVVDLACVVAHQPKVVLLDEPSTGIAQREAEALADLLLRVRDDLGASLLVIEHDMALLTAIADRLVAMDAGQVVAVGEPDAVLADPAVVASYLGTDAAVIGRSGH